MKKNDEFEIDITDIGNDGEGIGKHEGMTFFIKGGLPGDRILAGAMKLKKTYGYARLVKVLKPSPFRVTPKCPISEKCGGCQIQSLSYEKQLELKERKITENLIRIGGFSPEFVKEHMEPIVGMEEPFRYRNKAQYPIGTDKNGQPIAGFYAGRTHSIIPNTRCFLGAEENEEILNAILSYMKEYNVPAYDETTGQGFIRHVLIRKGFTSGELMVCLVINKGTHKKDSENDWIPMQEKLIEKLICVPGMKSISVNINTENTNVLMGSEVHTIWGKPTITDSIHVRDMQKEGYPFTGDALTFNISPLSFYQVNPIQTEKLYSLALEYAELTEKESVWDLYCGIGTISLFMARKAKQVYGVEIVPQAIDDARENAERNGITNAKFFVGKAEEVLPEFYEGKYESSDITQEEKDDEDLADDNVSTQESMLRPDVIVVDPPRTGCDEACLSTMLKMQPDRIVYVSCDSATLSRDLKILCDGGYQIKKIRGVDQFGHTVHVETVALLSKLSEAMICK
ncbi:MAG: 23S rRNA (uracil(1939)-C(5))-methyltransferase RlmD [Lachnospiraceae bacterium]|nr:23S rRNA (uracil(1939)-C(5))-methyltransferase RlmD [Lachnospiraceae bacterium]